MSKTQAKKQEKEGAKKPSLKLAIPYIITVLILSWIVQALIFTGQVPVQFASAYMYVPLVLAVIFYFLQKDAIDVQIKQFTSHITLKSLVFAVAFPFVLITLIALLGIVSGLGQFHLDVLIERLQLPFILTYLGLVLAIMPAMLGEEYGWRGYLLPTLTPKLGKIQATLIVGIVWGLWHIPSYYLAYSVAGIGDPILLTTLGVLFTAVFAFPLSYCYYLTRNIIPCIILHGIWDVTMVSVAFASPAVPGMAESVPGIISMNWPYVMACMLVMGTVVALFFAREFKKMKD
ncbi:CPBP family intramembrane metalloprotease [Candidatus Micrarchaeota archaeon]|nr:CPBP family intramembrane metalloprotease [Candidatus Micrarchaeota archaeon]